MAPKTQDREIKSFISCCKKGKAALRTLAVAIDASPASVRRDLIKLEQRSLVHRTQAAWNFV
jgi:DeoR family transcriptional regulator of aga operon